MSIRTRLQALEQRMLQGNDRHAPILNAETSDGGKTYRCSNGDVLTAEAWQAKAAEWQQTYPLARGQRFNVLVVSFNRPANTDGETITVDWPEDK